MKPLKKRRCLYCRKLFLPNPQNAHHQRFCCRTPACRKASKQASQRKWLDKTENRGYFRGPYHCARVTEWRTRHPGYCSCRKKITSTALQDVSTPQHTDNIHDTARLPPGVLQDVLTAQPFVLLGLIANITGVALQDDMAPIIRRLVQSGLDLARQPHINPGSVP